jgi:TolB-like protein
VFIFFLFGLLVSCVNGPVPSGPWDAPYISPGINQSVLILKLIDGSSASPVPINITINGQTRMMYYNDEGRIIIPNGTNTIIATPPNKLFKRELEINANSEQIIILFELGNNSFKIKLLGRENMETVRQNVETVRLARIRAEEMQRLDEEEDRRRIRAELQKKAYPGINEAVGRAGQTLIIALPIRSIVAVLNITARDMDMSVFIAEDIEYQLINSRKFTIVERNNLDLILAEQRFQMSGEVSDESAVSIGKMLGANIILTGTVTEVDTTRRLTIRAINVETGEVRLIR